MSLPDIAIYLGSFVAIGLGAKLVVTSAVRFCKDLHISPFIVSFVVLGLLTSVTEFAVGITSVVRGDPQIFMGNLLGGVTIIFLLIIPLLAIFGNGIKLDHNLQHSHLIYALFTIGAPAFVIFDQKITTLEAWILVVLYVILLWVIRDRHKVNHRPIHDFHPMIDLAKLIFGITIVILFSQVIIDNTLLISRLVGLSPFIISLIVLSLGTNLPELSLAVSSIISRKKDIAFGDYMGSASANTLFFGLFTLLSGGTIVTSANFTFAFMAIFIALCLFFVFANSRNQLSRNEGMIMLGVYCIFVSIEILLGNGFH